MEGHQIDKLVEQVWQLTLQVQSLERALHCTGNLPTPRRPVADIEFDSFATGDYVRILNSVKKPAKWNNAKEWSKNKAMYATVTRIQGGQIFFVTDNNGVSTWPTPKNLLNAIQHEYLHQQLNHNHWCSLRSQCREKRKTGNDTSSTGQGNQQGSAGRNRNNRNRNNRNNQSGSTVDVPRAMRITAFKGAEQLTE